MDEAESLLLSSMDDEVVGLQVKMGFERNFARYLDSEGRHEEAKEHWKAYYSAKRDYDRAMEKYLTTDELMLRAFASLNPKKVDKYFKENEDADIGLKTTWGNLKEEDKEYRLCWMVANSTDFKRSVRQKACDRFNEIRGSKQICLKKKK